MPSRTGAPRPARTLPALLLLVVAVAVATAGAAFASAPAAAPASSPDVIGRGAVEPAIGRSRSVATDRSFDDGRGPAIRGTVAPRPVAAPDADPAGTAPDATEWISRAETDTPEPRARAVAADAPDSPDASRFSGRNRVWIPALGIKRSISFFSCSSSAYPGNRVYRWGCAGRNNVYLFGHAHSVFKPLHDAYVRGNLKKGMKVYYADAKGRVNTYKVTWWRVTTPDKGGFAYAAQSRPSMTLQTCVGAKSQYRLIVRLVKSG